MEKMILNTLSFDMGPPTVNWFCMELLKETCAVDIVKSLAYVSPVMQSFWQSRYEDLF